VLRQISITPTEADEMELWQIGALLGADLPSEGIDPELWERERGTLVERAAAIRAMHETPEMVDVTDTIMKQMGIET
jgi:hypothetical protein